MRQYSLLTASAVLVALPMASAGICPPFGPSLPAPQSPSLNSAVTAAASDIKTKLEAQWKPQLKSSAISVAAKSIYQDAAFLSYHLTPPNLSGLGTKSVDENTIYRVGSISKIMPVLILLQHANVSMDDPVTKYIPELRGDENSVDTVNAVPWEDVTIGALASHLAGLGSDSAFDLAAFPSKAWAAMGLPPVPKGSGPTCSGLPGTKVCSSQDLIDDMKHRPPLYLPYTTPAYSNIGFAILGAVVEAVTQRNFSDAAHSSIFSVANMSSSSFSGFPAPFPERGFIPVGETTWNLTLGVYEAAGGMFSSTTDLLTFGTAVLANKLLAAHTTRQWLKPTTHTTTASFSVGAPWEILRSDALTADGRTVDVYTKTGDLGLYHGVLALVPDFGVVVSVLTGGAEVTANTEIRMMVLSSVLEALAPALDAAARAEAQAAGYTGTFVDAAANASLTLSVDPSGGPGLLVTDFKVRGFDVLGYFGSYGLSELTATKSPSEAGPPVKADARLYPSNRQSVTTTSQNETRTAWRAVIDTMTTAQKQALDAAIFYRNGSCLTWFELDPAAYDYRSLTDFVIVTAPGNGGAVTEIRNPAFNVSMVKLGGQARAGLATGLASRGVNYAVSSVQLVVLSAVLFVGVL